MSKWSHLPNALHIDRVLASFLSHPELWDAVIQDKVHDTARNMAFNAAHSTSMWKSRNPIYSAVWYKLCGSANLGAANVVLDTLMALIVYDNCGFLLHEKLEHVRVLAGLGVDGALLLLPACEFFEKNPA